MTPNAPESVRFTTAACELGRVLVAASRRGVCAVGLGEEDAGLERELAEQFPAASLARDDDGLASVVQVVVATASGTQDVSEVRLDLRGTPFQRRVWEALRGIPPGETRTYRDIAEALGRPSSARAVATACAKNKVAMLVPCHRVVRTDGRDSGYRWGSERKRALLQRERAAD